MMSQIESMLKQDLVRTEKIKLLNLKDVRQ